MLPSFQSLALLLLASSIEAGLRDKVDQLNTKQIMNVSPVQSLPISNPYTGSGRMSSDSQAYVSPEQGSPVPVRQLALESEAEALEQVTHQFPSNDLTPS